jgi:hypothetical protein
MNRSFAIVGLIVVVANAYGFAQQTVRRFEFGVQSSIFRTLGQNDWCAACPKLHFSAGPAATIHLNQNFAIDAAFTVFPAKSGNTSELVGGNVTQLLAGVRASVHGDRISLFAKARPGFVRFGQGVIKDIHFLSTGTTTVINGITFYDQGPYTTSYAPRTNAVLDLGGGLEYPITSKLAVRVEMGDTMMWWHSTGRVFDLPTYYSPGFTNNLQVSSGIFWRTGHALKIERPPSTATGHRFFDKMNIALFSASLLAQTADGITTQHVLRDCRKTNPLRDDPRFGCAQREADPLARPFVAHGWGGQIAGGILYNAAQTSIVYMLHRMGHHRVERFVTIPLTAVSGIGAKENSNKY